MEYIEISILKKKTSLLNKTIHFNSFILYELDYYYFVRKEHLGVSITEAVETV